MLASVPTHLRSLVPVASPTGPKLSILPWQIRRHPSGKPHGSSSVCSLNERLSLLMSCWRPARSSATDARSLRLSLAQPPRLSRKESIPRKRMPAAGSICVGVQKLLSCEPRLNIDRESLIYGSYRRQLSSVILVTLIGLSSMIVSGSGIG
jgi:hypothetical protein